MKTFTTAVIRGLLNQVHREEISFSRMVEIMNERVELLNEMVDIVNERVSEANEPQYKDGDFVVITGGGVLIFKDKVGDRIYGYAYLTDDLFIFISVRTQTPIKRYATEEEKQKLLDALAKEGKRWNAEKLCVEDIPEEPKKGDWAIFWDGVKKYAIISIYDRPYESEEYIRHKDSRGLIWANAIKFESKEQYRKLLRGEI